MNSVGVYLPRSLVCLPYAVVLQARVPHQPHLWVLGQCGWDTHFKHVFPSATPGGLRCIWQAALSLGLVLPG